MVIVEGMDMDEDEDENEGEDGDKNEDENENEKESGRKQGALSVALVVVEGTGGHKQR